MIVQQALHQLESHCWIPVRDADGRGLGLYRKHYSSRLFGRKPKQHRKFVGPGQHIVLLTPDSRSLFVWRRFIEQGQTEPRGINCSIFRRGGGSWLASDMILAAEDYAWEKWPGERLYTYVAPWAVESRNPGYCFKVAGWTLCRITPKGLHELEKLPQEG